jgi:hypothetical protein
MVDTMRVDIDASAPMMPCDYRCNSKHTTRFVAGMGRAFRPFHEGAARSLTTHREAR